MINNRRERFSAQHLLSPPSTSPSVQVNTRGFQFCERGSGHLVGGSFLPPSNEHLKRARRLWIDSLSSNFSRIFSPPFFFLFFFLERERKTGKFQPSWIIASSNIDFREGWGGSRRRISFERSISLSS